MPVYRATLFIKADPSVDPLDLLSDLDDLEMPTDPEPIGTIDHSLARLEGPTGRRYGARIWRARLGFSICDHWRDHLSGSVLRWHIHNPALGSGLQMGISGSHEFRGGTDPLCDPGAVAVALDTPNSTP